MKLTAWQLGRKGAGSFRGGGRFRSFSPRYDPTVIPKRDLVLGPQLAGCLKRDPCHGDGIDRRELRLETAPVSFQTSIVNGTPGGTGVVGRTGDGSVTAARHRCSYFRAGGDPGGRW